MKRLLVNILILMMVFFIFSCSPGSSAKKAEPQKPDFKAMEKRELKTMAKRESTSMDGYLTISAEWTNEPEISYFETGSFYYLPLQIGTEAPLECYIYKERLDMASSLLNFHNLMIKQFNITQREITLLNTAAMDDIPFMRVDLAYINEQKHYGNLKTIVANKFSNGVVCVHNEIGYKQTFHRIVSQLVKSLKVKDNSYLKDYQLRSISSVEINAQKTGIVEAYVVPLETNQLYYVEYSSILIPRTKSDIVTLDKFVGEISNENGTLTSGDYVTLKNGEPDMQIRLERQKNGRFGVNGTFLNKDIKMNLNSQLGLMPRYTVSQEVLDHYFSKKKRSPRNFYIYSPQVNPTAALEINYKYLNKLERNRVELEEKVASLTSKTIYDKNGAISSIIPFAGSTMKMERIYHHAK